jgi:hypothetical protein
VPKSVMGGRFRGRSLWENLRVDRKDDIGLLHIRNWKATEREIHTRRKEMGKAMARRRAVVPYIYIYIYIYIHTYTHIQTHMYIHVYMKKILVTRACSRLK